MKKYECTFLKVEHCKSFVLKSVGLLWYNNIAIAQYLHSNIGLLLILV